ncbi:WD40 repeat protein [Kribbella aluminosa]|uniref:WD40 repeat protein n=1 Tax=Kribbella aluminosa TaxID=416017 RepID=A0ABS4UYB7_9ACTN|nr:WD40 repeat domain-containing protein [Kribbella aluminosa]MBP2356612.1 WD40 repeat protein [Kribbella aluminosa]
MLAFAGILFAAVLVFLTGVVANWFPRPAGLTTGMVVGIAAVLIVVSAVVGFVGRTSPGDGPESGAPPSSPRSKPAPQPTTKTPTAQQVQALQPATTFGCDDTDNSAVVAMHPDGFLLACTNASATAVWNVGSGRSPSLAKDLGVGALSATFNASGRQLLTAGDSCWQFFDGRRPWNQTGNECGLEQSAASAVFAPDGKTFATRRWPDGSDVRFWDVASHKLVNTYQAADGRRIMSIAYSPTGRYFATGSADAHPYLWDLSHNGQRRQLADDRDGHTDEVRAVAFSPDGTRLISGGADRTAKIWSVPDGKLLASLNNGHDDSVNAVAFSPDGRTAVTGGADHKVIEWNITTASPIRALEGSGGEITSLSYDRSGKTLAAGCSDGKVVVWSLT